MDKVTKYGITFWFEFLKCSIFMGKFTNSFLLKEESVLFHSLLTVSN